MWYVNLYNVTLRLRLRSVSSYMRKKKLYLVTDWYGCFNLWNCMIGTRKNVIMMWIAIYTCLCVYFLWISKNALTWCEGITKVGNWWLWYMYIHTQVEMRKLKLPRLYAVAFLLKAHWQWLIDIGSLFLMVLINSYRSTSRENYAIKILALYMAICGQPIEVDWC